MDFQQTGIHKSAAGGECWNSRVHMDEEGGSVQHLKGPSPIKSAQSVTKDTFYEQLYCSAGGCPWQNRRAQLSSTYCLIWEILLAEKRNKAAHFYSHLQQN